MATPPAFRYARYAIVLLPLALAVPAAAHPLVFPTLPPSAHVTPSPTTSYVPFAAGHLVGDANGEVLFDIADSVFVPTAGFACQDTNEDLRCGGAGELAVSFCKIGIIQDVAFGGTWNPAFDVIVYEDNTLAICGTLGFWTAGLVVHA